MTFDFGSSSKAKHTLSINKFRGVDFSTSLFNVDRSRSPDAKNMILNSNGFPCSRNGYELVESFDGQINGVYTLKCANLTHTLVHHGSKISLWLDGEITLLREDCADTKSQGMQMEGRLYIFDGYKALVYGEWIDEDGSSSGYEIRTLESVGYIPKTTIGMDPASGSGTFYEPVNLIQKKRMNTFCVTSATKQFQLDTAPVTSVDKVEVFDGEYWNSVSFTKVLSTGIVKTSAQVAVSSVSGMDNVRITFSTAMVDTEEITETFYPSMADSIDEEFVYASWFWASTDRWSYGKGNKYRFKLKYGNIEDITSLDLRINFPAVHDSQNEDTANNVTSAVITATHSFAYTYVGWHKEAMTDDDDYYYEDFGRAYIGTQIVQVGSSVYLDVIGPCTQGSGGSVGGRVAFRCSNFYSFKVTYDITKSSYIDRINHCSIVQGYGYGGNVDRLFVSGNDDFRNYDWYSDFNEPTYFPDLNYTKFGEESTAIMGYSFLTDGSLAIQKNSNGQDPTVYIRTSRMDSDGNVSFPVMQGAVGVGAVSKNCFGNLGNDNLFLGDDGVYAIVPVANISQNERYAQTRSYFINGKLKNELLLKNAVAFAFKNRYYLAVNGNVYVADGNSQRAYVDKSEYYQLEWWFWDNIPVCCWFVIDDELYFGDTEGNVYKFNNGFTDLEENIDCYWHTPILNFGTSTYYKKIKNVCVTFEPYPRSEVHVDYIVKSIYDRVMDSEVLSEKFYLFDFNDIDFSDFSFETDGFPRNLATNKKAKKIMFMQFKIYANAGKPFGVHALDVLYTVSGKYKG